MSKNYKFSFKSFASDAEVLTYNTHLFNVIILFIEEKVVYMDEF